MYNIKIYKTASGVAPFEKYIKNLTKRHKDNELREVVLYVEALRKYGLEINKEFNPKASKVLKEQIFELRPSITRVFFYHIQGNDIIILHAYEKKTQKTDNNEIEKAIKEKEDYLKRFSK